jgi:hypothetical protein
MSSFSELVAGMRKQERVSAALPVKISPLDRPTQVLHGCTREVSSKSACLMKIPGITEGDVIWIARQNKRAKFKVSWVGVDGDRAGQIGVETLEPEKFIWDDELRNQLT